MSAYYKLGHVVCYVITELYLLLFLYKSINSTYTGAYSDKNDTAAPAPTCVLAKWRLLSG